MNRSGKFTVIKIIGDPKYNCTNVHKFINKVMLHGRKQQAAKIVYKVLEMLEKYYKQKNVKNNENSDSQSKQYKVTGPEILNEAVQFVKPKVLLRKKKIASKIFQVPLAISETAACKKALQWIVKGSRSRQSEKTYVLKLYNEFINIIDEEKGEAIKKKLNYHRIAKENEAFVHYV